jgi:ATP-dependent DNA ligase
MMLATDYDSWTQRVKTAFRGGGHVLCQPKLDGVRAVYQNGILVSRNGNELAPALAQSLPVHSLPIDGEIIAPGGNLHDVQRLLKGGCGGVAFVAFDVVAPLRQDARLQIVERLKGFYRCPTVKVHSTKELEELYRSWFNSCDDMEGIIIRFPESEHREGPSKDLLKRKFWREREWKFVSESVGSVNLIHENTVFTVAKSHRAKFGCSTGDLVTVRFTRLHHGVPTDGQAISPRFF